MTKIAPEQFAEAIKGVLNQYEADVVSGVKTAAKDAGNFCKERIKTNAEAKFDGSGKYADSWISEKVDEGLYDIKYVVHSKAPFFRLAHLLEYGHAKWISPGRGKGTKLVGFVPGRAHIRPAKRDMEKKYIEDIKTRLKRK